MEPYKVLNLYAGIGGNRKLWENVEVTAVEHNPDIAKIYAQLYPNDKVIVADAHKYLLDHFKEFDFIWSSPPCPTHSRTNSFLSAQGILRYPDMRLYEEIIFLTNFYHGAFCVENVISYYEPLIKPKTIDRHYFWANFPISSMAIEHDFNVANARGSTRVSVKESTKLLRNYHGIDISALKPKNERLLMRNCVNPKIGRHILECAFMKKQTTMGEYATI